jgi:hypothetical protein
MTTRKTNTPRYLSLIRKAMIYLGGATFLPMFFTKAGIHDVEFALQCWLSGIAVLQIYIDTFYRKDKEDIYKA